MFNDAQFRNELNLSAVNSINWARVMAQTVYYVAAIDALGDQPVSFSVPTGNFGNVLAGWIAREMGASVDSLIVGSNKNDILTRFFESHQMVADGVVPTLSPSMDIQVSSNFERLLFEMNDRDGAVTAHQLSTFRSTGQMAVEPDQFATWAAPVFKAARCNDDLTLSTMADVYRESGMLIDPHTAVGVSASRQIRRDSEQSGVPVVTMATAHPAKFPDAVKKATGVHPNLPEHLADLLERPERTNNLPNDLAAVQGFVRLVAR
jgi:threonine synthase